jgi:hypothetical protein
MRKNYNGVARRAESGIPKEALRNSTATRSSETRLAFFTASRLARRKYLSPADSTSARGGYDLRFGFDARSLGTLCRRHPCKADTARIRGIGRRWRNSLVFPRMPDSQPVAAVSFGIYCPVNASETLVVEKSSAAKTIKVTNSQKVALTGVSITITGDYSQTNDCGTTIAAKASCTVSVVFTPTTTGLRYGALVVADGASNTPQGTELSGTGKAPE